MNSQPTRFPLAHEYSGAIQNPTRMFRSPELTGATFEFNGPGRPLVYSGNFASNYVARLPDGKRAAVRVFLRSDPHNRDARYQLISEFLVRKRPPMFAHFRYFPNEVLACGNHWPVIVMEWVDGKTLDTFLGHAAARGQRDLFSKLRSHLLDLSETLESGAFSHGDLNPGNILVADDLRAGFKLIDFDGMFVPGMNVGISGAPGEEGTPGTRHPKRTRAHFGPQVDRFSLLAIDGAVAALAELPDLWKLHHSDPTRLLFDEADFQNPSGSAVFQTIRRRGSNELQALIARLMDAAGDTLERCPALADFRATGTRAPRAPLVAASNSPTLRSPAQPASQDISPFGARVLERRAIASSDFAAAHGACDLEVDIVGAIHEAPTRKLDSKGGEYLFINLSDWRRSSLSATGCKSVKAIIWGSQHIREFVEHTELAGNAKLSALGGRWVCVTGTPTYYQRHQSVDIQLNSMGQLRFITEGQAREMLDLTRRGQYRGGLGAAPTARSPLPPSAPPAPALASTPWSVFSTPRGIPPNLPAASLTSVEQHNLDVLRQLHSGSSAHATPPRPSAVLGQPATSAVPSGAHRPTTPPSLSTTQASAALDWRSAARWFFTLVLLVLVAVGIVKWCSNRNPGSPRARPVALWHWLG